MPLQSSLEATEERVLVCDGAMGTLPYAKGVFMHRCCDGLNLTQPALVAAVRPLVRGAKIGTAGRQFSSILGVLEAIG